MKASFFFIILFWWKIKKKINRFCFLEKKKNNGNLKDDNIWKINLINYNIFWIREFLQNDYERRFNVPIEIVLKALVSEKNLIQENEK